MRTRTRTTPQFSSWSWHDRRWKGTCANPWAVELETDHTGSSVTQCTDESITDVVTPGYHRLSAMGCVINNPYTKVTTVTNAPVISAYQHLVGYTIGCTPSKQLYRGWHQSGTCWCDLLAHALAAPDLDTERLCDIAVTSAHSKCTVNEAMIVASLGEFKETVSSLVSIFQRAVKIFMALKRLDMRTLTKQVSPKELADRWMEARYAIRPLVYDVQQSLAAFNKELQNNERWTVRGGVSDSATATSSGDIMAFGPNIDLTLTRSSMTSVTVRSGVLLDISVISQLQNWGADRLMSSAWELVPLSFVCDWFFNVGKVIASWEPTIGLRHLASWVTVTTTTTQHVEISETIAKWPTTNIYAKTASYGGFANRMVITKHRFPNPSVPLLPRCNVNLDAAKLLDLGLILKGALRF